MGRIGLQKNVPAQERHEQTLEGELQDELQKLSAMPSQQMQRKLQRVAARTDEMSAEYADMTVDIEHRANSAETEQFAEMLQLQQKLQAVGEYLAEAQSESDFLQEELAEAALVAA